MSPRRVPVAVAALAALALPGAAAAKETHAQHGTTHAKRATSRVLPAAWLHRFHVKGALADPDGDGLTNLTEYRAHTSPRSADTDHDGTPDAAEDGDHDGLDTLTEQRAGTNPSARDTDRDRLPDGREDADHDGLTNLSEQQTANDPGDPDSDDDGIRDGLENAGRVVSFNADTGVLTERLSWTGTLIRATVDDATALECSSPDTLEGGYDDDATAGDATGTDDGTDPTDPATDDPDGDDGTPATDDPTAGDDPGTDVTELAARRGARLAPLAAALAGADDPTGDDAGDDEAGLDDLGADDTCLSEVLVAGAWIHEADTSVTGDTGLAFDSITLVDLRD